MDEYLLYLVIALIITVIVGLLTFFNKNNKNEGEQTQQDEDAVPRQRPNVPEAGVRNRGVANRNARARMRVAQAQRQAENSDDSEGDSSDEIVPPEGKHNKKKFAKLQAKADKKQQREAEERERQEKKEREQERIEIRRQKEKEEEEEELKREEEERLRKEEEERREQEEYEKMKQSFLVEEEGFDETLQKDQDRDLLREFVNHIKAVKVVVLEDLAAKFQLKTQIVINRINDLVKDGTLTGVIDDRGKFIYISESELASVAKFIQQRGRVSISDIAEASNSLINLNSDVVVNS